MNDPLVTICIPVYNGADTLAQTLDSAYAQSYKNLEIMLVDNASTDSTLDIAFRYKERGLKIFENESNLGFNRNFNKATELANGQYVLILSADDLLYETCIQRLVNQVCRYPQASFAFSAVDHINKSGEKVGSQYADFEEGVIEGSLFIKENLLNKHNISLNSVLFNRRQLLDKGGFDNRYTNSDFMLEIQMAENSSVVYISDVLAACRVMDNSTGELELYGKTDLLSKKIEMLNTLFENLDEEYSKHYEMSVMRWVKFAENVAVVSRFRYGKAHAREILRDISSNIPNRRFHPRNLLVRCFVIVLPYRLARRSVLLASRITGKGGAILHWVLEITD